MSLLDNVLIYDVETTIYRHQVKNADGLYDPKNKEGSPFCLPQKLVMSGFKFIKHGDVHTFDGVAFIAEMQELIDESTLIVGCNLKFDLNWARRVGLDISKIVIWDCQLAEFMLGCQQHKYPSMNQMCEKYGLGNKLDVVSSDYWEKGIDTDQVPREIVCTYLKSDLNLTWGIFSEQLFQFKGIRL